MQVGRGCGSPHWPVLCVACGSVRTESQRGGEMERVVCSWIMHIRELPAIYRVSIMGDPVQLQGPPLVHY